MTKTDRESFKLPLSRLSEVLQVSDNNFLSLDTSIDLKKSSSAEFSLTSDIIMADINPKSDNTILSLNYSSGNSAIGLDTLIRAYDLQEARMRNKKIKEKGIETSNQLKQAKAVTTMYHFNQFGCKIGKTALQKKQEM